MSKVFVPQIPQRRDPISGSFVPTVNIAPAAEFGELVLMMPSNAPFVLTAGAVEQLWEKLQDYNFANGDAMVALGDPVLIAITAALLGREFGEFRILKWDKNNKRYSAIVINLST